MRKTLILTLILVVNLATAQNGNTPLQVFAFYTKSGKPLTFEDAVAKMEKSDVVLFGEIHNLPIVHWLELKSIQELQKSGKKLILGAEFFERDDQDKMDEYLSGWINEDHFDEAARFWPNYKTDYRPIVELAHDSVIPFIATNVPRRYAAIVSKLGLDTLEYLPAEAKKYLPELPITFTTKTPGYSEMLTMMGEHGGDMSMENFVKAQALKDATMAQSIAENIDRGDLFFHINGDFHSADYGGIYWYLKKINKKLKISTVKVFSEKNLDYQKEWKGTGDIILVVPEDFNKSY